MKKTVAKFEVLYHQLMQETGKLLGDLPAFASNPQELISMYRMMVQTRAFDAKAIALQRTGKLGTYPSSLGQEAISVGVGFAMQKEDVLCPYYREYGAQFFRGVSLTEMYLFWGGNELGSCFQNNPQDLPCCIPIASQTLHAVGVATAMKWRKERRAVVTVVGDGGTSRGDFYEAMNVAGNWKLPVVFVINNNQWAISVPRAVQTHAETIAQKGIGAGIPCEQLDGNDVILVRDRVAQALARAYEGEGPTVIEAITYRLCDHTTADDAKRYRPESEVKEAESKDPIKRLKLYLVEQKLWDETRDQELGQTCKDQVNQAVELYLKIPKQPPESMFDHLYETLPRAYAAQREEVRQAGGQHV